MLILSRKYYELVDLYSVLYYYESNCFLLISHLGIIKYQSLKKNYFFLDSFFFNLLSSSLLRNSESKIYRYNFFKQLPTFLKTIIYGFDLKYKIIGLGHRGYFSKNLYLFKIGYSHLVFCFLPINIKAKKKKKKKIFHKLYSINKVTLFNFFFHLKNMRVPDIYSSNGIYNRTDFYSFKKGKKSFML